jgi:hypothetical protein
MIYKLINKIPGCDFEVTIKWGKNTTEQNPNRTMKETKSIPLTYKILYLFHGQNPVVP